MIINHVAKFEITFPEGADKYFRLLATYDDGKQMYFSKGTTERAINARLTYWVNRYRKMYGIEVAH